MRFLLICLTLTLFADILVAQEIQEPQLKRAPKFEIPQVSKSAGLGGRIVVEVSVDDKGNVVSANRVLGPDDVCENSTLPYVVAAREAAKEAALKAKFSPAIENGAAIESKGFVNFELGPSKMMMLVKAVGVEPAPDGRTTSDAKVVAEELPSTISGGVLNGKAVSLLKPPYPPAARAVRATGTVSVQVVIDTDGKVFSARATSGHPLLQRAAVSAACGSTFSPTLLRENEGSGEYHPVRVAGIITYNFVP
jgi:TonB family protein